MPQRIYREIFYLFRRPDWRHQRVREVVDRIDGRVGRCTHRDDEHVRGMVRFHRAWRAADDEQQHRLAYECPARYLARTFDERKLEENSWLTHIIEARILAGQSDKAIAAAVDTLPAAIRWYANIYHDVRPKLGVHDWILEHALMPAIMGEQDDDDDETGHGRRRQPAIARPFFDGSLKLFGYFGGPEVLELMLTGFPRFKPASSREDVGRWLAQQFSANLKRRAATAMVNFDVNRFNVTELFAMHSRVMEIESSNASAGEKQGEIENIIHMFMGKTQSYVGDAGARAVPPAVGRIDESATELRDRDLYRAAAGRMSEDELQELESRKLPAPRRRDRDARPDAEQELA